MPFHRLTRRQALKLGAAAAALGALRPADAVAARAPQAFALDLDGGDAAAAAAGWRTTRIYDAPRRFDLVGLTWARGAGLDVQLRARRRGGAWTRWTHLHAAADHGPDGRDRVPGTDPVWTGSADQIQLRVRGAARGLQARFVRALPAARTARARGLMARAARRQIPGAPPIITREQWGADSVPPRYGPSYGQVQLAFVHHTVNANDYAPEDSAAIVLAITKFHRDTNGWNDLGYNFIVDQYGQIFEGRAGGIDQAIVGAQAQGFNSVSTGVATLGTFTDVPLPEAAIDAVARLIGWKLSLHGVPTSGLVTVTSAGGPTNRFAAGTPVTFERISGHRDGNATSCPGDQLYAQLPDLRVRAGGFAGPVAGVTLRAASTRLRGSRTAVLSGSLRFADASSPVNAEVDILYATGGGHFSPIASARATADGSFTTSVDVPYSGSLRARFPGDATRAPLESSSVKITVEPKLAMSLSSRRIRHGRRVAVSGVVWPQPAVAEVLLERKVRGSYRRLWRRRLKVRRTRYLKFLRPGARGLYRVTVTADGASERRYFRVL
jgi:hypothetical protein